MRAKKCVSILVAASLATTMLTACPWEKEEDKTDDASSVPVTSTDTSQDDGDHDSGDDDSGQEEDKFTGEDITTKSENGTVQVDSVTSESTGTYTITFTATPTAEKYIANNVSVEGATKDGGTFSGNWSATGNTAAFAHASAVVTIKPDDDYETFTVTGIPADATSCIISVTFENLGYVIEGSTYKVHSAKGLLAWNEAAQKDPSLSCTLTADINLTEQSWTPIGSYPSNGYAGTFDGGGHTISGLHVSSTGNYIGLFSYVDSGTVKNLNLEITSISGNYFVGGIAGCTYNGTIQGCMVSGSVSGSHYVGGVVGYNNETVEGCCFAGSGSSVTGSASSAWVGGVVGANNDTVEGCCFAGGSVSDTGDGAYVGGVVGSNYATITGCYWQVGTDDSPSQGVGSGNDGTTQVVGGWSSITDNAFTSRFTVDNTTHKPVPVNIRTSTGNTVVDTVLDAARVFWP